MDGVIDMAQTVRLDGDQVDKLVTLVKERKEKVLAGKVPGITGPSMIADEAADWDMILYALGEDDDE